MTVLVVEDDPALASILMASLSARARRVELATCGADALAVASAVEPDIIVLDLGLPDIDGIDVCRHLRRWFRNPILVLTADGAEDRKIAALDEGADDYVTKPFSMPELLARLRVALRHRRAIGPLGDDRVLRVGDLVVDVAGHVASAGGAQLALPAKEFALLVALASAPGRVQTHGALVGEVWGGDAAGRIESLRVHVTGLRRKLGEGPDRPAIVAETGVGYRLLLPDR